MNNILKPDAETLRHMYWDDKMTLNAIAEKLNVSASLVHKWMRSYGIPRRTKGQAQILQHNSPVISLDELSTINETNAHKHVPSEIGQKISKQLSMSGIGAKKIRSDGYVYIFFPDHPKSSKDGFIMEHILVMECAIGRWIRPDECVHHINHIRNDNRLQNLQLMTRSEHMRMHMQERWRNGEVNLHTSHVVNLETGERFASIKEAAKKYCVASSNISRACRYANRTSKGCHWAYIEGSDDLLT